MFSAFIFKLGWCAQLVLAALLAALSFLIQRHVVDDYLSPPYLAAAVTALLVAARVLGATLYRQQRLRTPALMLLRMGLLALSLLCSVFYFNELFHLPNAASLRRADLAEAEQRYEHRLAAQRHRAQDDLALARSEVESRYRALGAGIDARHLPLIRELEARLLRLQEQNDSVLNGRLDSLLQAERERHRRPLAALQGERRAELLSVQVARETHERQALLALAVEHQAQADTIQRHSYAADPRLGRSVLDRFYALLNGVHGMPLSRLEFIFAVAVFFALLLELAIAVVFRQLALAYFPLYQAEHERRLSLHRRRIETEGELQRAKLDERALQRQVDTERKRIEQRMRKAVAEAAQ